MDKTIVAFKALDEIEGLTFEMCQEALVVLFDPDEENLSQIAKNRFTLFVIRAMNTLPSEQLEEAFIVINSLYAKLYPNKGSLDVILTNSVRSVIMRRFGYNSEEHIMSKKLVKLTDEEKGILVATRKDGLYEDYSDRITLTSKEVYEAITMGLEHEDPVYNIVALLMISGSRPIELIGKAEFEREYAIGDHWVSQDYVAKRRDDHSADRPVIKPILKLTGAEFIEKLKQVRIKLREKWGPPFDSKGRLRSTISSKANEVIREMLPGREGVVLYTARKIYGNLSYKEFRLESTIYGKNPGFGIWLNNILGHERGSLGTAIHYSTIDIV